MSAARCTCRHAASEGRHVAAHATNMNDVKAWILSDGSELSYVSWTTSDLLRLCDLRFRASTTACGVFAQAWKALAGKGAPAERLGAAAIGGKYLPSISASQEVAPHSPLHLLLLLRASACAVARRMAGATDPRRRPGGQIAGMSESDMAVAPAPPAARYTQLRHTRVPAATLYPVKQMKYPTA